MEGGGGGGGGGARGARDAGLEPNECLYDSISGGHGSFFILHYYEAFSSFPVLMKFFFQKFRTAPQPASVTNLPLLPLCCCPWVRPFLRALTAAARV
jgi:hypothetical protein